MTIPEREIADTHGLCHLQWVSTFFPLEIQRCPPRSPFRARSGNKNQVNDVDGTAFLRHTLEMCMRVGRPRYPRADIRSSEASGNRCWLTINICELLTID